MRDDGDRDGGIIYIGPRAFVAGFAILCAIFLVVAYGVTRLNESIDSQVPVADVLTPPSDVITGQRVPFVSATPNVVAQRGVLLPTAPARALSATPNVGRTAAPIIRRSASPTVRRTPMPRTVRPPTPIIVQAPKPVVERASKPAVKRTAAPIIVQAPKPAIARTRVPPAGRIATPRVASESPRVRTASHVHVAAGAPPAKQFGATDQLLVPFTHAGSLAPRNAQSAGDDGALLVGRARPPATPSALPSPGTH